MPDEIVQVAEVPRTLTGQMPAPPVKELLLGRALADMVNGDTCANPGPSAGAGASRLADRFGPAPPGAGQA